MATGLKYDIGKIRASLVLGDFSRALTEVCKVGGMGAAKYSDGNWVFVDNGVERYTDAMLRHWLQEQTESFDNESNFLHAAHTCWNSLARLELMLREIEENGKNT